MSDTYFTKDIGTAAFFVAHGVELGGTTLEQGKVVFLFGDQKECKRLDNEYRFNNGIVEARKFYNAIRDLKTIVFRKKEGNNVPTK